MQVSQIERLVQLDNVFHFEHVVLGQVHIVVELVRFAQAHLVLESTIGELLFIVEHGVVSARRVLIIGHWLNELSQHEFALHLRTFRVVYGTSIHVVEVDVLAFELLGCLLIFESMSVALAWLIVVVVVVVVVDHVVVKIDRLNAQLDVLIVFANEFVLAFQMSTLTLVEYARLGILDVTACWQRVTVLAQIVDEIAHRIGLKRVPIEVDHLKAHLEVVQIGRIGDFGLSGEVFYDETCAHVVRNGRVGGGRFDEEKARCPRRVVQIARIAYFH
jgi:hypothetical protein